MEQKYIHGYNLGDGVIGLTVDSWSSDDTNNNNGIIINTENTLSGYTNISSYQTWEREGEDRDKKPQISYLYSGDTWSGMTTEDKKIVAKYFLVDKSKRDEVLTQEEQDEYNYYIIYDLLSDDAIEHKNITNKKLTPKSIDYKIDLDVRLNPKYTFNSRGHLTECIYYKDLSVSVNEAGISTYTYSTPVLRYQASYVIGSDNYTKSRTVTRSWYLLDGTLCSNSKITTKIYEAAQAREEGVTRRNNIINQLLINTVGLILMTSNDLTTVSQAETDGVNFLKEISEGISEYYQYGSKLDSQGNPCKLIQQISASTYTRLNNYVPGTSNTVTIRMYILSKLNV